MCYCCLYKEQPKIHQKCEPVFWPSGLSGITRVNWYRILLKQETVSGNGINWAICISSPRSRQITMPASHHSVFTRDSIYAIARICYGNSVCLSVRLSVTRVDQSKTVEARITQFSPYSSPIPLVFRG